MNREYDKKYDDYPEYNPNVQVTLTPLPNAENKAKLLGYEGYGIFKILEAERQIDLEYLVTFDCNLSYRIGEEKTDVLLVVYEFLFGYNKVFDTESCSISWFAAILLRAIHSKGKGLYIHNHLCKMGYYDDQE